MMLRCVWGKPLPANSETTVPRKWDSSKNLGFSQRNFKNAKKGLLKMHPSTTTSLSDAVTRLANLDSKLDNASFMPQEQLLGLLISGSMVISAISKETTTTQFTDDEIDFITTLTFRIEDELAFLYGVDGEIPENQENEDWDS